MDWKPEYETLLRQFVAAIPIPPPYSQGGTDDMRREWIKKCSKQFRYTFGLQLGTKSAHAALVPRSTDALAYNDAPKLWGWDIIRAGGDDSQAVDYNPETLDITGQYFLPQPKQEEEFAPQNYIGEGGEVEVPSHIMKLGYSCFWALGGIRRLGAEGRATLEEQFTEAANGGADFLRIILHLRAQGDGEDNPWCHIGLSWKDAEFQPDLVTLCGLLRQYSLKGMFTFCGGSNNDMQSRNDMTNLVDRACGILSQNRDVVDCVEMWNEVVNTGGTMEDCQFMASLTLERMPGVLCALSSPTTSHMGNPPVHESGGLDISEEVESMHMHGVNLLNVHIRRSGEGANTPPYVGPVSPDFTMSGEPRGPESSVASTDNPDDLQHDWTACYTEAYYGYVFHPDAGIWSIYITDQYKDGGTGQWRLASNHNNGVACMQRLKELRGSTVITQPPPSTQPPVVVTGSNKLLPAQRLGPGGRLVSPTNSHHTEYQAQDNNLVTYRQNADGTRTPIWASKDETEQPTNEANYVEMQAQDGNFCLYNPTRPEWCSNTAGNPGAFAELHDDGYLVVKTKDGQPIWRRPE